MIFVYTRSILYMFSIFASVIIITYSFVVKVNVVLNKMMYFTFSVLLQ